ncbi:MAG TPA: TIGR02281 family clan AA aspartic protease [Xanthobacteraceae bacterium]
MRSLVTIAALVLVASVVVPRYAVQMTGRGAAQTGAVAPAAASVAPNPDDPRSVVIPPSSNGHFHVEGRIDGRRLNFMVDTGASVIALTERDASMLGIHPTERDYVETVSTANGIVRAAPIQLGMVEIDDLVVHDVAAVVLPDGALSQNLLGLSFLSRLRRFEYSDGRLVLEQ